MSLIIAMVVLSSVLQGSNASEVRTEVSAPVADTAAAQAARKWVALLDGERWEDSWHATAGLARSQVTAQQWASTIRSARQPLGRVSSRVVQSATRTSSLPGAPAGDYEVVEFRTTFATGQRVETIVLSHEASGWKVAGYFIK